MGKRTLLGLFVCAGLVLVWVLSSVVPADPGEAAEEAPLSGAASDSYGDQVPALVAPGQVGERAAAAAGGAATPELPAAATQGPRGRLLAAGSEAGIGGMTLDLVKQENLLGRVVTKLDGRFAFPEKAPLGSYLALQGNPRFRFEPKKLVIRRLGQADGSEELIFRAEARPEGVVQGRVIDARTFEPLPAFRLSLRDAIDNNERVVSDVEGYFLGVTQMLPGSLRVGPRDEFGPFGRYPLQRLAWEDVEETLQVAVRVGPTYRLLFQAPTGRRVEGFFGEVRGRGEACLGILEREFRSRLRPGQPPWVRLRPAEVTRTAHAEYELVVTSEDGFWVGRTPVQSVVGIHPGILPLDLQAAGVLRGRIRDQEGEGTRARILLTRDSKTVVDLWSTSEGSLDIPGLLEGEYECQLFGVAAEPFQTTLRILAGEITLVSWELQMRPREYRLLGRLRAQSGRLMQQPVVSLYDEQGQSWPTRLSALEERGESFLRVEARRLPAGVYRPVARFGGAEFAWECKPAEVRAVAASATEGWAFEILVQDIAGEGSLQVLLTSEEDGRPLDGEVYLVGQGWSRYQRTSGGRAAFYDLPPEPEVWTWYVRAQGYLLATGQGAAQAPTGGRVASLEVGLRPGWGAVVRVLAASDGAATQGIAVLLDGISQGRTDAQGRVVVQAPGRPQRLTIESTQWSMLSSRDVLAPAGQFRVANWADVIVHVESRTEGR